MRNIKLLVQYDGSRYSGWQSQEHGDNTIQGKLTTVLERMLGEKVKLLGSGRTDAGVHAAGQVANFYTNTELSCEEIRAQLNQYLPEDIGVLTAEEVPERFHSRLSATGKTYVYRIWNSPTHNVFDRRFQYTVEEKLDVEAMREAAALLIGTHDYKAFSSFRRGRKSTVRIVESIVIEEKGDELVMTYTGSGFLYHMVRILTGTLIEVGLHKREAGEMPEILASLDRERSGFVAPAKGLCLKCVYYG